MEMYFVYKFKVKGTGFFYIGVTTDLLIRKNKHVSAINYQLSSLRFRNKPMSNLQGYKKVAASLIKGRRFLAIPSKLSADQCDMQVLSIKNTPKAASILEHFYLQKYKGHKNCFNTLHISTYSNKAQHV